VLANDVGGPHSWWSGSIVAGALRRTQALCLDSIALELPAPALRAAHARGLLLTAAQLAKLELAEGRAHAPLPPALLAPAAQAGPAGERCRVQVAAWREAMCGWEVEAFSEEHVYPAEELARLGNRALRRGCRWLREQVSQGGPLALRVHPVAAITKDVVGACQRCRNVWERARTTVGVDGLPRRHYYLSSLGPHRGRGGEIVLFTLQRREPGGEDSHGP
jgi:hypothetical protein